MSFITFEKGAKAKILRKGDIYYNKDYYTVVAQHPRSGHVILKLPNGVRKVYASEELKKYIPPPDSDAVLRPLLIPPDDEEKTDDAKAQAEFFARRSSDKTQNICPLCGKHGYPSFNGFKCNNKLCENSR